MLPEPPRHPPEPVSALDRDLEQTDRVRQISGLQMISTLPVRARMIYAPEAADAEPNIDGSRQ